ncbi:6-phospho-beta-glucosidase [Paenibacillus sp. N1-5-1-14]|uniref:6-phospho-beta-glucosidase n=1 Tax=Paenibacillus radicibacter TaxID=2972488 RepID=UPI00215934BE|nr:6-phospho-beta-glucosidase [Paenibacillus radicibacter]MCR8643090.1 6-phospho-beta-glucosidase [Paenibacillus radicibacter]
MSKHLKLVVIGGGSSYTPELIEGLIKNHEQLPIGEVWLVDIPQGEHKLNIVGNLAKRMVEKSGLPIRVELTLDRRKALPGADFVSTQMRVGLLEARAWDEAIPLKYGVIGQETTGPGGMMKALRTIPVLLDVCRDMEELCPDAWMLNFTNPAGMVTEAINKHSKIKSIGLCNSPVGVYKWVSKQYEVPTEQVYAEFVGLNHLHWVTQVNVNGESKLEELLQGGESYSAKNVPGMDWNPNFIQALGAIPTYYLKYFYFTPEMLAELQESAQKEGSRAEVVKRVEDELFELYKDPDLNVKPAQLEKRGGAFYSEAAVNLMCSLYNDKRDIHTLNVSNGSILPFLPEDASIEVNCIVTKQGPIPIAVTNIPPAAPGLILAVKTYESLAIEAAVTGDRGIALQAMACNPLVPSVNVAEKMLDEMLEQNKAYLPKFF